MAAVDTNRGPRTYGNWRRPTSPGILGLGSIGTALLLAGLIAVVMTVMIAGLLEAVILAAVLGAVMLAVLTKDSHGKNVISRGGARIAWWSSRSRGSNVYRSGPLGRALWGTYQLPGLAAPTRLSEWQDSYGRPFALLYTPATGSYSVVIGTEPDGAALVDQEQIDVWVADWGHWLANLGDEPGVEAASVTIETAPDSGTRLRREVEHNVDEDAPPFSKAMLADVVGSYPAGSSTVKAFVAITFSAAQRSGSKKRKPDEMGRELAARLPGLTAGLQATGAGAAHPLSAQELCEVVRVAYDPAAAVLIDAMVTGVFAGDSAALSLRSAFPKMHAMESAHGGLVRAMLAKKWARLRGRGDAAAGGPSGPGGVLSSFEGGFATLVERLAAALGELLVGFLEALGRAHHAVLVVAAFLVASAVQREQHVLAELGGFLDDGVDRVRRRFFVARQLGERRNVEHFVQNELDVFDRGLVDGHCFLLSRFSA